jgi:hypothetical protein
MATIEVPVVFHSDTKEVRTPGGDHIQVTVVSANTDIVFNLSTLGGSSTAAFHGHGIEFHDPQPPAGVFGSPLPTEDGLQTTLSDANPTHATFHFSFVILFEGNIYTPDPAIINEPPITDGE